MAEVVLKKAEKVYPNGFKAVHGIDLHVKDGEFMVLVGPSGCAKSTTLRMIAGLEDITGGEIWIGDRCVNDIPPKDRGIAMVFQNYALYPHMTAYENMAFGLKFKKTPKDEIDARIKEAAKKLEITELLDRKPKEMSGGQRQRIAVGRAIVRKPDVFLFDEPLSNLDAKLRVSLRVEIKELHTQLKKEGSTATMIYVTHDQVEAMTMGDRICVLDYGRIMQVDTPLNLYHKPKNKFVASFIGAPTMNIMETELDKDEDKTFVKINDEVIYLEEDMAQKVDSYIGKRVYLGIRPEDINMVSSDDPVMENTITGEVLVVEQMGNEEIVYFGIDGNRYIARQTPDLNEDLSTGAKKRFHINMRKCHIFDFETEENIIL
ncbi:ABC transporter ATP-binding protein [Tissierella creatinophila]|uniref:sn-glycerol-3-phosphate import ATP-binding protein UgpC n=1 Tax=Tissierella creatinophila DSM 6911 TaxID=1123403 RepID=A0A1U7M2C3_TISCR|nr:sn-glycerol-3-phosphate ABC transporter ATP-binding protein UgpC [Tissierella creatinophila]OLS01462.1 sn-glycerol-3-phosphate import ATP-binding protein UgpC [Tissierella creatinophila DSM 6911]